MHSRTLVICAAATVLAIHTLDGQSLLQYRNFAMGSSLATVSTLTGMNGSAATTIHQRPVVLQDLEWRLPRWIAGSRAASTDPVEQIVFSFYDDRLFRVVVDYRPEQTEGLTDADLIEAIAAVYGTAIKPTAAVRRAASPVEADSGTAIARWASVGQTVVLYRTSTYRESFRLIVTDPALDALAQKAAIQALRLDEQEAPQREIAKEKKEREAARAAAEKARSVNKDVFRP